MCGVMYAIIGSPVKVLCCGHSKGSGTVLMCSGNALSIKPVDAQSTESGKTYLKSQVYSLI